MNVTEALRQYGPREPVIIPVNSVCFECGAGFKGDQKRVARDVQHEDGTEPMRIYAHLTCAQTSANDWGLK